MHKKKVLVHGTADSLQKFFADAISRDFEIVAVLSEDNISINLEVLKPQALPHFNYKLLDGIIFTGDRAVADYFLKQGLEPRKIILWDAAKGLDVFGGRDKDGVQVAFIGGLEFHIRNEDDAKFFNQTLWQFQTQRYVKNLSPQAYPAIVAQTFQRIMGKPLDFNNPRTFTEKLNWLKVYDATPIKSRLADKYLVRRWVADKIGQEYLIPLLGVWDDFDDINFDELPNQFVLKCNHGCGMNIIVRDKSTFDKQQAREKLNAWLALDFSTLFIESHYTRIKRKIIAEKFMANGNLPDLIDYKFICFHGKIVYCQYLTDRSTGLKLNYFDENWNVTTVERNDHPRSDHPEKIRRPKNFKLMKKLATKLAEGFAFVRVDFYEIDGRIYFGEMTFTPGAGNFYYKSAGTDEYLGNFLTLPAATPPPIEFSHITENLSYRVRQKFLSEIPLPPPPEHVPERKIIASLTSWTKRIGTAHLAIQTILNQTRQPDLTVLYLATDEFPRREEDLPRELLALRSERFEIRWTTNIRSYKKLIPALKDFPDDIIITFDDDLLFRPELVERLLIGHKKYPTLIQCHRITNISFDGAGNVKTSHLPYDRPSYLNKLTGCGSVLYPPHSLYEDVLREDKFMTLAPTSDDIWFWLMGVLNGRRVNVVENNIDTLNYIPGTQAVGLSQINDADEKFFFKHLDNILNAYPVLRDMLHYEQRLANGK